MVRPTALLAGRCTSEVILLWESGPESLLRRELQETYLEGRFGAIGGRHISLDTGFGGSPRSPEKLQAAGVTLFYEGSFPTGDGVVSVVWKAQTLRVLEVGPNVNVTSNLRLSINGKVSASGDSFSFCLCLVSELRQSPREPSTAKVKFPRQPGLGGCPPRPHESFAMLSRCSIPAP